MTPDKNAIGHAKGMLACPGCGDSVYAKPFHHAVYATGRMVPDNLHAKPGDTHFGTFEGEKSFLTACEDCWAKMTLDEKLACVDYLCEKRMSSLPSITMMMGVDGEMVEWKPDRERREKHAAMIKADHEAAKQIIRGG